MHADPLQPSSTTLSMATGFAFLSYSVGLRMLVFAKLSRFTYVAARVFSGYA